MDLHIGICDDERAEIQYLKALVDKWLDESGDIAEIRCFESAEGFLFTYAEDKSFDILLLDIQMKKMDGVALAKQIRQNNQTVQIVFITGFPDFIAEGYEVSALHYLMKPVKENKLFEVLYKAVKNLSKTEKSLFITVDGENIRIPMGDVMLCESFGHTTAITTKDTTYEVKQSLSELKSQLDDTFIRCHRSYLVGIRHICRITKTDVILDNSKQVPLSRRLYDSVNQAFIKYFKEVR